MTDVRVLVHQPPLFVRQHPCLAQDLVRDGDLADVVERRGQPQQLDPRVGQTERPRDVGGEGADALEMRAGGAVVVFDRTAQPSQCPRIRALERGVGGLAALRFVAPAVQRVRDVDGQVVGGEGLRDVAVRAELQGGIDDADVVVAGDHDSREVRPRLSELFEQLETRAAGEPDVAEHDGEVPIGEQIPRGVDAADSDAGVPGRDDHALDQRAYLLVVVNAKQALARHAISTLPLSSSAARTARASSSGANGFLSSGPFTSCARGA